MGTKTIYENLESWQGGKANGYYEPFTDEIHILKGKDLEFRTLVHETVHASRQNKLTFKFASIIQVQAMTQLLFGVNMVTALVGVFTSIIPFLFTAGIFSFLIFCVAYEEYIADLLTAKSMKEIKRNCNHETQ